MKKLVLALPLIAGASWAGTTLYSGAQTQPAYERFLEQMNSTRILVFESKNYDAGFMKSTAVTEVRFNDEDSQEVLFTLNHKISHSPVRMVPESARFGAANIVTTLALDKIKNDEQRDFLTSFDTGEPFVITTDVAMDGTTTSEIKINAVENMGEEAVITSSAATVNLLTGAEGNMKGNGELSKLLITDNSNERGEVSDLTFQFDMDKLEGETSLAKFFYNINLKANVAEAKIVDNSTDEPLAIVKDIYYGMDQKLADKEPYVNFSMGVNSIATDAIPLRSLDLKSAVTGFQVKALIANADYFAGITSSDEPDKLLFTGKGLEIIRATFPPDTRITIDATADTLDGAIDAKIKLWFAGNGSPDGYTGMVTVGDLAKAFAATININADKSAIIASPLGELLGHPFALLYLNITDDKVILNASLDRLSLLVNGQTLPLELMAGEMLTVPLKNAIGF